MHACTSGLHIRPVCSAYVQKFACCTLRVVHLKRSVRPLQANNDSVMATNNYDAKSVLSSRLGLASVVNLVVMLRAYIDLFNFVYGGSDGAGAYTGALHLQRGGRCHANCQRIDECDNAIIDTRAWVQVLWRSSPTT